MYFNGTGVGRDYSEASEGWRVLPTRYDDPAYSGGNLDRPALQRLLKDLHAEMVDVVVVYKIDRAAGEEGQKWIGSFALKQ